MRERGGTWSVAFRRTARTAGLVALVAVPMSCAPAVDTAGLAAALTRLDEAWSQAAVARNVDSVAAFYAEDATAYPPDAPAAVGFAAAKKVWADAFADSSYHVSWKTTHADASKGGDIGYTTGTYEESFNGPGGKRVTDKGKYVCIWSKQPDGTWKAIRDIWNADAK
jgi:ketosteroid isomerase-like protein